MENASKALIMAGSILIAILIIALLVYGYNQLSETEQIRSDAEATDKVADYMRQFEQFNRTLYGSELLSLANLQEDYNTSETREDLGYDRIEITVKINKEIPESPYFTLGSHSLEEIANDQNDIEEEIDNYDEPKYNNKNVKYYSQRRNREIAIDFGMNPPSNMLDDDIEYEYLLKDSTTSNLISEIQDYRNLTSIYNEFRTGKRFRCTETEYNNQNGRINLMHFEEITK